MTATVPAGAKTGQKISITTAGGVASSPANFGVVPAINSFTPTSGPVGTSVAICGTSFTGFTKVTFGGVAAISLQVINDSQVDALVPAGAATGPTAVTPGGTATQCNQLYSHTIAIRFTVTR